MKKVALIWPVMLIFLLAPAGVYATVDIVQFARITASDTRDTWLWLWPRETDDGPFTIRDGQDRTGWKTPKEGEHWLQLDFGPTLPHPPVWRKFVPKWEQRPAGPVKLVISAGCGGEVLYQRVWSNPMQPFEPDLPIKGYCVTLELSNPGRSNLIEFEAYAAQAEQEPAIDLLAPAQLDDGISLSWVSMNQATMFVNIHYVKEQGDPLATGNLIDTVPAKDYWEGPHPGFPGAIAAVVPLDQYGNQGQPLMIEVPSRQTEPIRTSGAIEAFFGTPWSHGERRKMILHLARKNLGLYIYAPKWDPLHRDDWRTPYSDEDVSKFIELHSLGSNLGVEFSMGISPGIDFDYDDPDEPETLIAKLEPFLDAGFRHFTLLFDDIEWVIDDPIDGVMAANHRNLIHFVKNRFEDLTKEPITIFVNPTCKNTACLDNEPGGIEYVAAMGGLDPDIRIFWGGLDVWSATLAPEDLILPTDLLGRKPVHWDNQHANDGGDAFIGKVWLAPYGNREPEVISALEGIVSNLMILGGASRMAASTYADFMADPFEYDPVGSLEFAAAMEGYNFLDDLLAYHIAYSFYGSSIKEVSLPVNRPMNNAVDEFTAAVRWGNFDRVVYTGSVLMTVAAAMSVVQNAMHNSGLDVWLVDDMWFPTDRLSHEGMALLYMLRWYGKMMAGRNDSNSFMHAQDLLDQALFDRYQLSLFKADRLFRTMQNNIPLQNGFEAPNLSGLAYCYGYVGHTWIFEASTDAPIAVFGLPGANIRDNVITWVPDHPGVYQAIIIAVNNKGWNWREVMVTVHYVEDEPPKDPDDDDESTDVEPYEEPAGQKYEGQKNGYCCG